jgi:hypothetical protein
MTHGRTNVVAGGIGLLLCALGGMALGMTFDQYAVKDGAHVLSLTRFYLREGHSHGMPISLLNLVVGLAVDRLALSDRLKRACSWLALAAFLLPLGLAAKGAAGAPASFPPIGLLGVAGFVGAALLLVAGGRRAS